MARRFKEINIHNEQEITLFAQLPNRELEVRRANKRLGRDSYRIGGHLKLPKYGVEMFACSAASPLKHFFSLVCVFVLDVLFGRGDHMIVV